jgi:hypothetical protein
MSKTDSVSILTEKKRQKADLQENLQILSKQKFTWTALDRALDSVSYSWLLISGCCPSCPSK